jgi:hypothetical protein
MDDDAAARESFDRLSMQAFGRATVAQQRA